MSIKSKAPVNTSGTFDYWSLMNLTVQVPPEGPARLQAHFRRSRNTGNTQADPAGDEGDILLTAAGESKYKYELLEQGEEAKPRTYRVGDLDKLIREQAAAGNTEPAQAMALIEKVVRELATAAGVIDGEEPAD